MRWEEQQGLPNSFSDTTTSPCSMAAGCTKASLPAEAVGSSGQATLLSPLADPQVQAITQGNRPAAGIRDGTRKKRQETGGLMQVFFCTSVFLTPQPVAAYNKTEIRKSNQNTHPKAKNPRLKQGAARPPEGRLTAGSPRGRGNTCPGWEETQHKGKTNQQKNPPNAPAAEQGRARKNKIVPSSVPLAPVQ